MAIALSGNSDGDNIAGTSSLVSSENRKGPGEMVGGCSVCSDDQGTEENSLVYCDGCELAVHQACYGIVAIPPGNWYCRVCESNDSRSKIKCELCPSKDGALKKTETGQWAHVVCALYIPEIRFGNNNTMEPIEIKHILADRFNKSCYLCEESGNSSTASYGAVMNCHKLNCKQSFHVTCAQTAGLLCEEAGQGSDNVIYCGYCKHHFRKLKAGNRKSVNSLNNSSSSYYDSASDSSQDNDSRCNTTELDKNQNRTNKLPTLPTNLSMSDTVATGNSHSPTSVIKTNETALIPNNAPISLTIPLNPTSDLNKISAMSNSSSTPQKKRRTAKNVQGNSSTNATNNSSSTLLATAGSLPNSSTTSVPFSVTSVSETNSVQDPYYWSSGNKEQNSVINNNTSNNKNNKKKATSSTPSATNAKPPALPATQSISMTSYNLNKISSPNLSLSTSPSLASPSNSTKSTSNSSTSSVSTTTATSSSSSSTSSNSPSPALLSPNISNRCAAVRLESPLASNPKTGNNNMHNRPHSESVSSDVALPSGQNNPQTRKTVDNAKNDPKKNPLASSSLLSTTVPMPHEQLNNPAPPGSSSNAAKADSNATPQTTSLASSGNDPTSSNNSAKDVTHLPGQGNSANNSNTQPTVPPLVIPVPQTATKLTNSATKPTATAKAGAKGTRKKSTENNEGPKAPEPKAKPSRAKKTAASNNGSSETSAPKPEPKRGKSKAAPKSADTKAAGGAAPVNESAAKTQPIASSPAKRKSRSASNESGAVTVAVAPSPAKRQRKKKTDQTAASSAAKSNEQQPSVASSNPPLSISTPQLLSTTSNAPVGTSPLMINPPVVNNGRLMSGMNSVENQDMGNRYFSPMISPYANFDHLSAPSLSRSSLSRLFMSSSANSNQINPADDPAKAFDELRENTWTHLSKCVLEQAQQFDIPSLIGTLYILRSENEKLVNKVRDLTMRRDQLIAINARLDLPGPMLTQHLNNTSPNFSAVVSGLTNSPKSLPTPSPGSAISKQPLVSVGPYNHAPPGSLGPPGYLDRSSPLVGQTHSGVNNIKSSSISTPSPPIGALMAHSTSNRAGLITVNPPYMPNVFPQMNSLAQLGTNPQGSSYYPRQ